MAVLKRGDIKTSTSLPKETVEIPELGGEVVVRGMTLTERLTLSDGANSFRSIALCLSWTVLGADSLPLMTFEEWDVWGASRASAAMRLFSVAGRLSGMDAEALEKKSESTRTSEAA